MPLVFSLILTVASRLLHPYGTNDKTSRLMEKKFSTMRDTQKGSLNYLEKRRGQRGDRGDQEEKRGNQMERERILASNQILVCSPQSGTSGEVHRVT